MKKRNGQHSGVSNTVPSSASILVASVPVTAPISDLLKVQADEQEELAQKDKELCRIKVELADIVILLSQIQAKRVAFIEQVEVLQEKFRIRLATIAKTHGIDPVDPSKGHWSYDLQTGSFTKLAS